MEGRTSSLALINLLCHLASHHEVATAQSGRDAADGDNHASHQGKSLT
jgi:hypothetical protein